MSVRKRMLLVFIMSVVATVIMAAMHASDTHSSAPFELLTLARATAVMAVAVGLLVFLWPLISRIPYTRYPIAIVVVVFVVFAVLESTVPFQQWMFGDAAAESSEGGLGGRLIVYAGAGVIAGLILKRDQKRARAILRGEEHP